MKILQKLLYTFNVISFKIPTAFFQNRKIYSKIHMEYQSTWNNQNNISREEQRTELEVSYFLILKLITKLQ